MRPNDINALKRSYPSTLQPEESDLERLADPLGLNLADAIALGDAIVSDLDPSVRGISWWSTYTDIGRQERILISDYLVACARNVPSSLVEAKIEHLEFNHAIEDFGREFGRRLNIRSNGVVNYRPPRGPFDDLAQHRVNTHMAGMLRAWGTALDGVGSCLIGVAGLSSDLKKADIGTAWTALTKASPNIPRLAKLYADFQQAETDAGPSGWRQWLQDMRNTVVHRGRRTTTWSGESSEAGLNDFMLRLPSSPDLSDVEGAVYAGGQMAAVFASPGVQMMEHLATCVNAYVSSASKILLDLWTERRASPALLSQDPKQWKKAVKVILPLPTFRGFPDLAVPPAATTLDVGSETATRLHAAALAWRSESDIKPDPQVWS